METLYCGSDELECLIDKTAEDLLNSVPTNWLNTEMLTLPRKNPVEEKGHSWIITDKDILMEAPMDYWKKNKGSNNVPIVIGNNSHFLIGIEIQIIFEGGDVFEMYMILFF